MRRMSFKFIASLVVMLAGLLALVLIFTVGCSTDADATPAPDEYEERINAQDEEIKLLRAELELLATMAASNLADSLPVLAVAPTNSSIRIELLESQVVAVQQELSTARRALSEYANLNARIDALALDVNLAQQSTGAAPRADLSDYVRRLVHLEDMIPEDTALITRDLVSLDRRLTAVESDLKSFESRVGAEEENTQDLESSLQTLRTGINDLTDIIGDTADLPARKPFELTFADNAERHEDIVDWILTATELINWLFTEVAKLHRLHPDVPVDEVWPVG